ncbi:nucleotidyltransferase family protein [candidate division KSB1 bacterium]
MIKIKVLILAAGYATRLFPLTKDKPKPLLPIAGKPMIEYIIEKICPMKEIDGFYVVTNNKFFRHFEDWNKGYDCGTSIEIINDGTLSNDDRKGAIGDMKYVIDLKNINDDLMVVGGDNLFEFEMQDLIDYFIDKQEPIVVLHDVKHHEIAMRMGVVEIDDNEKLISFVEKPENPKTTLIAICMYLFPKKDLIYIDKYLEEGRNPDAPGRLIEWLHTVRHTLGFVFEGLWFDIGDHDKLKEADELYTKKLGK